MDPIKAKKGSPYKLWSDGQTLSLTCSGADAASDCLFACMALNASSECLTPWLVQTHSAENSSLDTAAKVLHIYGRSLPFLSTSDLQKCEESDGKDLFALSCGDGRVAG